MVNDGFPLIRGANVSPDNKKLSTPLNRELAIFIGLSFFGLLILPLAIYVVGHFVFGEYGEEGMLAFYGTLYSALRNLDAVVLFLVLSPYVVCQMSRLTLWAFRKSWELRGATEK